MSGRKRFSSTRNPLVSTHRTLPCLGGRAFESITAVHSDPQSNASRSLNVVKDSSVKSLSRSIYSTVGRRIVAVKVRMSCSSEILNVCITCSVCLSLMSTVDRATVGHRGCRFELPNCAHSPLCFWMEAFEFACRSST